MAIRDDVLFPGYDVVAKTDQVTVSFFDYGNSKDDAIQVQLNEEIIVSFLDIASGTKSVDLDINAGENRLRIVGAADRDFPVTVGMTFDSADVYSEYNDAPRTFNILLEEGITFTLGLPVIRVDGDLYPQSAQHIIDTLGEPTVTKVKRADNNSRRRTVTDRWRNINGNVPLGYQVDESLPASLRTDNNGVSTRAIPARDNQGAGGSFGGQFGQLNRYGPENIRLPDDSKVDFFATNPPRSAENIIGTDAAETLTGTLGNDIIRGLGGNDLLRGDPFGRRSGGNAGGRDQIFGGAGDDIIGGKGGDDILMGQKGNDTLYGDGGDDILNGGEGNNILIGDALDANIGADVFILQRGGFATIKDFQIGIDRIGLYERSTSSSNLIFSDLSITQSAVNPNNTLIIGRGELVGELENVLASRLNASSFIQATDDFIQARIPSLT